MKVTHLTTSCGARTALTAAPRCAATTAARQPLKLPSPSSADPMATSQYCSWQAVVVKASILRIPGKLDCLDWSWLEMR